VHEAVAPSAATGTTGPRADRAELLARYPFPPDRFQVEAFDALDAGRHVVVAAPTGSGKTVVAEYGIETAIRSGRRAFYTAPIKALSNQKYRDLIEQHGGDRVGLLTGDNSINGDADVVVMTTEVLRNMIYGRRRNLGDLGLVVLDEVHFLQDAYRGPVWEEVIIHLPASVRLVCLSATVSNVHELAEWIGTVRGPTDAVVEHRRPVQLDNLYLVGDRTHERIHLLPTFVDGRPNPDAARLDASAVRYGRGRRDDRGTRGSGRRKLYTPGRVETTRLLDERRMLPAIHFIFSRNQCDEAARACLEAGLRLTSGDERDRIREIVQARLGALEPADLAVLGYAQFVAQLDAGVAAHHAGMVPPFKEVVEACFVEGLVKVVFATETLAVGINMPARTVVIEKLTKFTGDHHEQLTPGEYTQLTGRAGRRGIDELGHAVVAWSPFVRFDQVAELASSRAFHLRSAFRPTYNMAANLVRSYTSEEAHHLLNLSFAQFQADRDVVRIEARLERQRERLTVLRAEAESPFGDLADYRRRRDEAHAVRGRDDAVELAMLRLRPGTIVYASKGKYRGPVAVVASANRKGGLRITAITPSGDSLHLTAGDFGVPPRPIGSIGLPTPYAPNRNDYRRDVGRRIRNASLNRRDRAGDDDATNDAGNGAGSARRDGRASSLASHPVEDDPDLAARLRAATQADRVAAEVTELEQRAKRRNQTLSRELDGVLEVLAAYGYVDGWMLTDAGEMLARTFHESDLLVTQCVRLGLLDGLEPADLAGLASVFVYEHRSPDDPPAPWFPSNDVRRRWRSIEAVSDDLAAIERSAGLGEHRHPDPTFAAIAHAWVAGEGFAEVVADEELTGGDFVRTMKQLIDLLGQLAQVAPDEATRRAAQRAADDAFRGVVADSSSPGGDV
jgi:ATP-dependent RNA helicase HelY